MGCWTEAGCCVPGAQFDCGSFFASTLAHLGAPQSANNIAILERWAGYEGTRAPNNPLATTQCNMACCSGHCNWNSVGVRCYPSLDCGAAETANTLNNGYYPAIVAALRADAPLAHWSCSPIPAEINTWGTGGFATFLRNAHGCPTPTPSPLPSPVPPPTPPPGGGGGEALPTLLLLGAAGLAGWELYRKPALRASLQRRLAGTGGPRAVSSAPGFAHPG